MTARALISRDGGFTLFELVIIIVVLGIISVVAIAKYSDFVEQSRIKTCEAELATLKKAIVGNANFAVAGRHTDVGFEGSVGYPPASLVDLVRRPDTVPLYSPISRLGWNGPYLDSTRGDYLKDAWGVDYIYDPDARTIKSVGSGIEIIVSF